MKGLIPSVVVLIGALAARADILTYGFQCITHNDPTQCAIGEAQFYVDVVGNGQTVDIGGTFYGPGANEVLFRFRNVGPVASVIKMVLFDHDDLNPLLVGPPLSIGIVDQVAFTPDSTPGTLPGGNSLTPPFTEDFSLTANAPPTQWGIDPGEALGVRFTLATAKSWDDVIGALNSGSLRIGLHAISIGGSGGGSEGFVNNGVVPEPAAILLVGSVLLILGRRLRRPA